MSDLPTLPTYLQVIDLGENNAPRSCNVCRDPADLYVFVTDEMVEDKTGEPVEGWAVNEMLCRGCFEAAPRVAEDEELVSMATAS